MGSPSESARSTPQERRERRRILWSFVRPHRRVLVAGVLLGLVATAATLAVPLITKNLLDTLGSDASLLPPVALLVGLLAIGLVAGLVQYLVLGRMAEHIVLDARVSLISRFFRGRLQEVQRHPAGELVTRVTSDTALLREASTTSLVEVINGVVALVGTLTLMAFLDVPLLVAALACFVVIGLLLAILMPRIGEADRQAQEAVGELGGTLEGGLRALRTVKASRAEGREIARAERQAQESARHAIRSVRISSWSWTIAAGGTQLAIIAILGFGAWRVSEDAIAVSTLVAFLLYAFNLVEPISSLTMASTQIQSGLAAAERIRQTQHLEIEEVAGAAADSSRAAPSLSGMPTFGDVPARIRIEGVTARYAGSDRIAVDGVTVEIPHTGHVAIVGPSGAGKTTVFSLLLRFVEPASGRIVLDGFDYRDLSIDAVRARIAYVEQETPVIPGTVRDNVLFRHPDASDDEAWAALETVGLTTKIRGLPDGLDAEVSATTLSGGERQRLAVARALVKMPQLLLLDEATAQLDGISEAAIQRAIREVSAHGTVVTIAHRLSTVVDADRIIVMDDGRVRAHGTHHELLGADALYRELVAALRIRTPQASASRHRPDVNA